MSWLLGLLLCSAWAADVPVADVFVGKTPKVHPHASVLFLDVRHRLLVDPEARAELVVDATPELKEAKALALTEKRAEALVEALTAAGVPGERLTVTAGGAVEGGGYVRVGLVGGAAGEAPPPMAEVPRSAEAGPVLAAMAGSLGLTRSELLALRETDVSSQTRWWRGPEGVSGVAVLSVEGSSACRAAGLVATAVSIAREPSGQAELRIVCADALVLSQSDGDEVVLHTHAEVDPASRESHRFALYEEVPAGEEAEGAAVPETPEAAEGAE
jgi:hypothetical protein